PQGRRVTGRGGARFAGAARRMANRRAWKRPGPPHSMGAQAHPLHSDPLTSSALNTKRAALHRPREIYPSSGEYEFCLGTHEHQRPAPDRAPRRPTRGASMTVSDLSRRGPGAEERVTVVRSRSVSAGGTDGPAACAPPGAPAERRSVRSFGAVVSGP